MAAGPLIRALPCLAAALLAASLHWLEGGVWLRAGTVLLALLGLGLLSNQRGAIWPWAWVFSQLLSLGWNGGHLAQLVDGPVPFVGLAILPRQCRVPYRLLVLSGALLAAHAVISFIAFRLAGGAHGWRPELAQGWLRALVWPYYCGHYPRGAHAIGLFLNDNLLGVWCVSMLALALELPGRARIWLGTPLLLAVGWSYSRSAYLALLGASGWLAWRRGGRILLLPALIPLLFLAFAGGLDHWRFGADWANTLGGRLQRLQQATALLGSGSLLGTGPGSAGLVDSQWLKSALELGWLGLLVQLGFCLASLGGATDQPGLQGALIALALGAVGCDLWHSPHLAATFFLLCGHVQQPAGGGSCLAALPLEGTHPQTNASDTA